MAKNSKEWLKQAKYDFGTAQLMFRGRRHFYAVFMCHLSIEKALKGIYFKKLKNFPPKTHSLIFLIEKIGIRPSEELLKFLVKIDQASVATRYPEDLAKLQKAYTSLAAKGILNKTSKVLQWAEKNF